MEISIIIMTLNNRDVLRRAIEVLFAQAFPHDQYEIIVVAAYSTDGTAEMVQALDGPVPVRLVMQPGRGRAAARNLGARAARGRILLYLDSDIWSDPGVIGRAPRALPARSPAGRRPGGAPVPSRHPRDAVHENQTDQP